MKFPLRRIPFRPRRDISPGLPIERPPESRFAVVEFQRAEKKLRKAMLEHYK